MAKPPPPVVLTPPKAAGSTSKTPPSTNATLAMLVKDRRFKAYADKLGAIKQWAQANKVDPVDLLSALAATGVVVNEGSLNRVGKSLSGFVSLDAWAKSTGQTLLFDPFTTRNAITKKAGFVSPYVPAPPQTVSQTVDNSIKTKNAKAAITDPWMQGIYKTVNGKKTLVGVRPVKSLNAPKDVVQLYGAPIRKSEWERSTSAYNDYFQKYLGRSAKANEIAAIINHGLSPTAVQTMLTNDPAFKRGPIWQAQAPAILAYAKNMLGENFKFGPDSNFLKKAIVNNWSEGTLRAKIRAMPEYLQGPEFKQNVAGLQNVYSQIQGRPDEAAVQGIKEAALGGWSSDQYAAYLRAQPQYTQSQEYKGKALSFLDALGMITGQQTTTQGIQGLGEPTPIPGSDTTTPNSPRLSPSSPGVAAGQVATKPVLTKNKAGTQAVRPVKNANQPGKPGFRPF